MNRVELTGQLIDSPKLFESQGQINCGRKLRFSSDGEIAVIAGADLVKVLRDSDIGEYVQASGRLVFNPHTRRYGICLDRLKRGVHGGTHSATTVTAGATR
jgi:hypothetical protein